MKITNILDKKKYNDYVLAWERVQFAQSWEWGNFQSSITGCPVFRIGIEVNDNMIFAATLIKKKIAFNKYYFYCPRINIEGQARETIDLFFEEVEKIAKEENIIFLRFEPLSIPIGMEKKIIKTIDIQPKKTIYLNLKKDEKEILKEMHQKTRYNIGLAKRRKIKIKEERLERFNDFWRIMRETAKRDKFRTHDEIYYRKMLNVDFVKLYFAEYKNKVVAANIVSFFGDTVTYLHGASTINNRDTMATYLLQWHVISKARKEGYKYYDFFGIDEKKWPGVTRFKKGFGGKEFEYPGTYDLVFNKGLYNIYKIGRKIRRAI